MADFIRSTWQATVSFLSTTYTIWDTVKKARTWLDANGLAYTFHDYKKQGADPALIAGWIGQAGVDKVVNRAGTTYRKLDDSQKAAIADGGAPAVLAQNASVIKRPIVEHSGGLLVGFKEADWAQVLL